MGEIQVTAKYSSLAARVLLYILLALIPIWGVLSPFLLIYMIFAFLISPAAAFALDWPLFYLASMCGFLVMTGSATLACIFLADNKLIANKEGLRIPCHASLRTYCRRDFLWTEITSVVFSNIDLASSPFSRSFSLVFQTRSGLSFSLLAAKLSDSELEKLLLALELWCDNGVLDERLAQVKELLQNRLALADAKDQSYTAMWEDELERRFNSTAFVVLEPETLLQDGKLKVVRQLSFGGLSAVYLCQKERRDLVVLKEAVVPADTNSDIRQKADELFAREARLLMALQHHNIVTVLDYFVEKGRNYLLLEHINGPDLRQYVRQHGPQPEYRVIAWAKTLAEVLVYLHSQNPPIIHRDLSPDNVLLDQNNALKIIDFGAAQEFIGTATGTLIGKQSYLPMEQLRGKAVPQSDIYALGCTLHFLLTGDDPEPLAISHPRELRDNVSEALDALVAQCTDSDYKKRPQSAAELVEMFSQPFKQV